MDIPAQKGESCFSKKKAKARKGGIVKRRAASGRGKTGRQKQCLDARLKETLRINFKEPPSLGEKEAAGVQSLTWERVRERRGRRPCVIEGRGPFHIDVRDALTKRLKKKTKEKIHVLMSRIAAKASKTHKGTPGEKKRGGGRVTLS